MWQEKCRPCKLIVNVQLSVPHVYIETEFHFFKKQALDELYAHGIHAEELDGNVQTVKISALKGKGNASKTFSGLLIGSWNAQATGFPIHYFTLSLSSEDNKKLFHKIIENNKLSRCLFTSGLDKLEESILIQAELLELKANKSGKVEGVVLESRQQNQLGSIASAVVQQGTLERGKVRVNQKVFLR